MSIAQEDGKTFSLLRLEIGVGRYLYSRDFAEAPTSRIVACDRVLISKRNRTADPTTQCSSILISETIASPPCCECCGYSCRTFLLLPERQAPVEVLRLYFLLPHGPWLPLEKVSSGRVPVHRRGLHGSLWEYLDVSPTHVAVHLGRHMISLLARYCYTMYNI